MLLGFEEWVQAYNLGRADCGLHRIRSGHGEEGALTNTLASRCRCSTDRPAVGTVGFEWNAIS